jgi:DHA3 family macrolide efflux protein-like MFS transporter
MTSFVLAIWTFERNWSTGQFSTVVLAAALPNILMAPFAGALVDRWDKRRTLMWSVIGQSVATFVLATLFATGRIHTYWQIYPAIILIALCGSFQNPALGAASAVLLSKESYSQASAMWQLNSVAVMIISPLLAAALLPIVNMQGIVLFDALSYLFALIALFVVRIPNPSNTQDNDADSQDRSPGGFLRQVIKGWSYIQDRRPLLYLLVYGLFIDLVLDMVQIAVMPLSVRGGSAGRLASVMAASAFGMVAGTVLMTLWPGPKRRIGGVLGSGAVIGAMLVLAGTQRNAITQAVAFFLFTLFIPFNQSCSGAIWLSKTARELMGRVTATTSMFAQLCFPLACFITPLLTDRIFVPLLVPGGTLSTTPLAAIFGVGQQRGVGLLLAVMGLGMCIVSLTAYANRKLRCIETDLPEMSCPEAEAGGEPSGTPVTERAFAAGEQQ